MQLNISENWMEYIHENIPIENNTDEEGKFKDQVMDSDLPSGELEFDKSIIKTEEDSYLENEVEQGKIFII